jgi:hypothetical protein
MPLIVTGARLIAWALFVVVATLTVVPPALRPISGLGQNSEHFTIFLLMGVAFAAGYRNYNQCGRGGTCALHRCA